MSLIHTLEQFSELHSVFAFGLVFLLVVIEGEIALIFSGIAVHLHILHLFPLLPVLFVGAVVKSIVWYYIGVWLAHYFPRSHIFEYLTRKVQAFLPHFKDRPFWSIFISKFIYGINHFTLVFCGYTKTHFKTYFKAEFISSIFWVAIYFLLGLILSYAALAISHDLRKFMFLIFLFIILYMGVQKLLTIIIEFVEETQEN